MVFARLAGAMAEVAAAARATPQPATPPRAADLLLDGLALLITDGYAAGTPVLEDALSAFAARGPAEEGLRWRSLAADTAVALWDDRAWETILDRHLELARATGALDVLPLVLDARLVLHLLAGEMTLAAARHDESRAVTEATGRSVAPYSDIMLAALQGRQADVDELRETLLRIVVPRAQGLAVTLTWWATAVCANGLGRYDAGARRGRAGSRVPGRARLRQADAPRAHRGGDPQRQGRAGDPSHSNGSRRRRVPPARTGGWGSRPAPARC